MTPRDEPAVVALAYALDAVHHPNDQPRPRGVCCQHCVRLARAAHERLLAFGYAIVAKGPQA